MDCKGNRITPNTIEVCELRYRCRHWNSGKGENIYPKFKNIKSDTSCVDFR